MQLGTREISPSDQRIFPIDYSDWLAGNEVLSTISVSVTPITSPALSASAEISGTDTVLLQVIGAALTVGETYSVILRATTDIDSGSGSQIRDDCVKIHIVGACS